MKVRRLEFAGGGTLSFEHITPEQAEQWLVLLEEASGKEKRLLNRKLSVSHERQLRQFIETGKWHPAISRVVISRDDIVIDGQHTLAAIRNSNSAVECLVIRGVDKDLIRFIGVTDLSRSTKTAIGFVFPWVRDRGRIVSGIKFINRYLLGDAQRTLLTFQDLQTLGEIWAHDLNAVVQVLNSARSMDFLRCVQVYSVLAFARKLDSAKVDQFVRVLAGKADTPQDHVAAKLSGYLSCAHKELARLRHNEVTSEFKKSHLSAPEYRRVVCERMANAVGNMLGLYLDDVVTSTSSVSSSASGLLLLREQVGAVLA